MNRRGERRTEAIEVGRRPRLSIASTTEPFTQSSNAWTKAINTHGALDAYPALSMNARELIWITRPVNEGREHRLRSSTRLDTTTPFESSTAVTFTSGVLGDGAYPSVMVALPNGTLYFSMADPLGSPSRIFRAEHRGSATYAAPVAERFVDDNIFAGRPLVPTNDELAAYVARASDSPESAPPVFDIHLL